MAKIKRSNIIIGKSLSQIKLEAEEKIRKKVEAEYKEALNNFSKLAELTVSELKNREVFKSFTKKYSREDIIKYLESPERFENQLRELSRFFYINSQHYRRLIQYFSNMLPFCYILKPTKLNVLNDNKAIQKSYIEKAQFLQSMNLPHEFNKISKIVNKEDAYFGYELSTKDSYMFKKLDPKYCHIANTTDGCLNFEFDMSYFDVYKDELETYPDEFKNKYQIFKENKNKRWALLDPDKTICIKANEEIPEIIIPPFIGLALLLMDIEDFKALKKSKEEINIYKLILMQIPMKKDGDVNEFMVDANFVREFHKNASATVPDQVGVITTPFEVNEISFDKDKSDIDAVSDAIRDFWGSAGVSQHLFTTDKTSSIALSKSIMVDEMICFGLLRQFERWTNRKIKLLGGNIKFEVNFLNVTYFSLESYREELLKQAQFGVPIKLEIMASYGLTPLDVINKLYFENEVLDLAEKFIPLNSSHTQSGDKKGRDEEDEDDLGDEGLRGKDGEKNLDD